MDLEAIAKEIENSYEISKTDFPDLHSRNNLLAQLPAYYARMSELHIELKAKYDYEKAEIIFAEMENKLSATQAKAKADTNEYLRTLARLTNLAELAIKSLSKQMTALITVIATQRDQENMENHITGQIT